MTVTGVDVSSNILDWVAWKGHRGISFGLVKATEGLDFDEPAFDPNWEGMRQAGLRRFAYHYAHPAEDPSKQATFFTGVLKAGGLQRGDNMVLDLEISEGLSPEEVSFWAYVFCKEAQRMAPGRRILPYVNPSFAEQGNCAKLFPWFLWVADWGVPRPSVPPPWKSWAMWQTAAGNGVDYDEFNGTEAEFLTWSETYG